VIGSDGDRDGIPNAVLEAHARGLCVVASCVGGIDEVVFDGKTGRLVEPGDVAGLARVLGEVIGNPGVRRTLGAAALAQAGRDWDAETGYDRIAALLRERIS
jgi:glycosyltransferase involved in cell wall biosynthesis